MSMAPIAIVSSVGTVVSYNLFYNNDANFNAAVTDGGNNLVGTIVQGLGGAMMMPVAFQMAKRSNATPAVFLMPMSFASLLGGLITLIGTSPNIIVSRVREEMTGAPFKMFDYAPVGLGLTFVGLIFLRFAYRLLPRGRRAAPTLGEAMDIQDYVTEAEIPAGSPAIEGGRSALATSTGRASWRPTTSTSGAAPCPSAASTPPGRRSSP